MNRTAELRELAQRIAGAMPDEIEEAVVTGSVSRGCADEVSDIEMLLVTPRRLTLDECYGLARTAGLEQLGSWGPQGGSTQRVSGYRDGVPIELIWWSREDADRFVAAMLTGESPSGADALLHGIPLRTHGSLARWRSQLADYPEGLAAAQIEDAALTWGGFAAAGLLTLARDGERLSRLERMLDDVTRILRLLYALNRMWQPTTKRLALRVEELAVKPDRLAERIDEALAEQDPVRALRLVTQLQLDTVMLAPSGPNIDRARRWLADGLELL
jgi:predicted nucleotidyltransferase